MPAWQRGRHPRWPATRGVGLSCGGSHLPGRSGEPELLASAYAKCLDLAVEHGADSISFPSISSGAYGYPVEDAAEIATGTLIDRLRSPDAAPHRVLFVLFDDRTLEAYQKAAERRRTSRA